MKSLAVIALLALAASASANVLRGAAPKLGKIARRAIVRKLVSRIPRSRALEGHTTSVDMCAADDMDACMDSTCEMWDANKASLEDAVERLETCDWTEESTMSSTTWSVNFAECDAVSDFESTCGSVEGESLGLPVVLRGPRSSHTFGCACGVPQANSGRRTCTSPAK